MDGRPRGFRSCHAAGRIRDDKVGLVWERLGIGSYVVAPAGTRSVAPLVPGGVLLAEWSGRPTEAFASRSSSWSAGGHLWDCRSGRGGPDALRGARLMPGPRDRTERLTIQRDGRN